MSNAPRTVLCRPLPRVSIVPCEFPDKAPYCSVVGIFISPLYTQLNVFSNGLAVLQANRLFPFLVKYSPRLPKGSLTYLKLCFMNQTLKLTSLAKPIFISLLKSLKKNTACICELYYSDNDVTGDAYQPCYMSAETRHKHQVT